MNRRTSWFPLWPMVSPAVRRSMRFCLISAAGLLSLGACGRKTAPEATVPGDGEPARGRLLRGDRPAEDAAPSGRPRQRRAALTGLLAQPEGEAREAAIAAVAWDAVEDDPGLAAEAIDGLEPGSATRLRLLQHLAMRMAEDNPAAAVDWAGSLDSEIERSAVLGRIALVIAEEDPERAAGMLSESGVPGRDFGLALVQVVDRWAAQDAAAAGAWVTLFPEGEFRTAGIQALVARWFEADASSLAGWLGSIADPQIRAEAAVATAKSLAETPAAQRGEVLRKLDPQLRAEIEGRLAGLESEKQPTGP